MRKSLSRFALLTSAAVLLLAAAVSGQGRQAATPTDELLAEVRALRADINSAARSAMRGQLLGMRLQLQEQRIGRHIRVGVVHEARAALAVDGGQTHPLRGEQRPWSHRDHDGVRLDDAAVDLDACRGRAAARIAHDAGHLAGAKLGAYPSALGVFPIAVNTDRITRPSRVPALERMLEVK